MKVLHIVRTMGQGGAEKVVYQLCSGIKEVEHIVASCGGHYEDLLMENNVKHFKIPDIDKKNPFLMLFTLVKLFYLTKKENVEIIHSHHRMAAFYIRIISCFVRCKCIYTSHNIFSDKILLTRIALKKCKIIAVGDGVKNNLIDDFGINESQIKVIYNSIDNKLNGVQNEILHDLRECTLIGTIGRITEQKGIDVFIKAMNIIVKKYNDVRGIIVGDGELMDEMSELVRQLELDGKVLFLGYQSDILDIIKQLDILILSSRWEGLPLILIEVFSQMKTIIASDIPGNNEIVIDGYNGCLFEKDNYEELAEKLVYILNNKDIKEMMEKNALQTYKDKYEYSIFLNSYKQVYEELYYKD